MSPTAPPHASGAAAATRTAMFARLCRYLWPADRRDLRLRVILAVGLLVAGKVSLIYVPFLYKAAVDRLDGDAGAAIAVPVLFIVAYGIARVASQAFNELRDLVFARVAQRAVRQLALETFRHLHALSLRFHLERQTGGLSRVIERGTKGIAFLLRFMVFNVVPTALEIIIVAVIFLALYEVWFALVTVGAIGAYIAFSLLVTEWRTKYLREMNRTDEAATTHAIDSLLNFETVKHFGNEAHEAARFDRSMARYEEAAIQSQRTLSVLNVGQGAIIAAGAAGVMLLAGYGVANGTMTLGDFVLVNTFMIQLYQPLGFLGFVYREIRQSLVDMEKMFQLLYVPAEVADAADARPLRPGPGEIEFDDVRFAYHPQRPILKGISFRVPAGHTVAIVGPTGAGKSTISRLIYRFYDATGGAVRIDGQDIRQVTQDSLRRAIGIVPQDTVLFNDTIRYNIRYGRPDATDEAVREAAALAQIDRFIASLPDGYEATVGERGLKLSGGEKQRVAIARTILKSPTILLLDEATSALDTGTEQEIQSALRRVAENRTTLVIAHRLSTVIDADEILVLDEGLIVQRGRHGDLLAAGGLYADLWARQQQQDEAARRLAELRDSGIRAEQAALGHPT